MAAFMSYFEHLAKLSQVANRQTMFLAHMLSNMTYDRKLHLNVVDMSPRVKLGIMEEICPELSDTAVALNRANQYLSKLKKSGLVKPMTGVRGVWMIDPESYGYHQFIDKRVRKTRAKIYATYEFTADNAEPKMTVTDEDGNTLHQTSEEPTDG